MSISSSQAYAPASLLTEGQWLKINEAITGLDNTQITWVSGYLAGLAAQQHDVNALAPVAQASPSQTLTILYGSQTGNAKGLAVQYQKTAEAAGYTAKVSNMADYKPKNLKSETHLVIVVSTHGEGDAPDDAVQLHEFLHSKKAPKLSGLKYAVLGLGDSSYEHFCQTAKEFDQKLAELGAQPMADRLDCDVDYEDIAAEWTTKLTETLKEEFKTTSQVVAMPGVARNAPTLAVSNDQFTKKNPYPAVLTESLKVTGRDSIKDIRHIEISLEDSDIQYLPGDALGVWFLNDESLVDELLEITGIDASDSISIKEEQFTIREALIEKLELTLSYPGFVVAYAEQSDNAELKKLVADKSVLRDYLAERQIIDVVREFPAKVVAQDLVNALRPLTPRLYSIASSQSEVEDEVHLTVALVEYEKFGKVHQGGASGFLGRRLEEGANVKVYVENNDNFRLPEDPNTPVIMVGPGTGIAPFRAFMQQRDADEAEGKNWLFFGNPHFTQDFLYQTEWQQYMKEGLLDKITLAFSRDQEEKVYVQHRLIENGAEVYAWLESGAHFYVCGDATHMAKDVNDALINIVEEHGQKSREEAEQYVTELRRAKRYQKDVY